MSQALKGCVNCGADDHDTKDCKRLPVAADGLEVVGHKYRVNFMGQEFLCSGPKGRIVTETIPLCRLTDAQRLLSQWEARCVAAWEKGDTDGQLLTEQALDIVQLREELAQRDAEIKRLNAGWHEANCVTLDRSLALDAALARLAALESQQAASVGGEREAFEQIHKLLELSDSYLNVNGNGRYKYHDVQHAWEFFSSYLASRAALSPAGGGVVTAENVEMAAQLIYTQWDAVAGYVPWVKGGNSIQQDYARKLARELLGRMNGAGAVGLPCSARDVLAERKRQINAEGWTPEHDDHHSDGALAKAAACYAANAGDPRIPKAWPWQASFWKPGTTRRMLVKSGALILAEIERLDRAEAKPQANSQEGE